MVLLSVANGFGCHSGDDGSEAPASSARFIKRPNSTGVVVFIHGIFGSAEGTWRNPGNQAFFPDLLVNDPRLPGLDAYVIGFQSPYFGKGANLEELTQSVYQRMVDDEVFGKYTEIYFVGHSMGGLIAEAILVNLNRPEAVDTLSRIKAVITVATPAQGAPVAALADYLSANPQLRDLAPATLNSWLQSLHNKLLTLRNGRELRRTFYPRLFGAYELLPTHGVSIVSAVYAQGVADLPMIAFARNHESIVKPFDRKDDVYVWLAARLRQSGPLQVVASSGPQASAPGQDSTEAGLSPPQGSTGTSVTHGPPVLGTAPVPRLACAGKPSSDLNAVDIRIASRCEGCSPSSATLGSWVASPVSVQSHWSATQKGFLDADAQATAGLGCSASPDGTRVGLSASYSALAGWGGVPNNYRYAEATVGGTARTAFEVTKPKAYCVLVATVSSAGTRTKGYPGSYEFQEGSYSPNVFEILSPSGKSLALAAGRATPLSEAGVWSVAVKIDAKHYSNWSENSGRFTFASELLLRFPRAVAGKCP
jgi:pimeloyl-ACP methyl ester carboxylesterase